MRINIDIINQLLDIYMNKETWHNTKLSESDARTYFEHMLKHGKLLYCTIDNNIAGYIEWYNITYDQFKRLINREEFHIADEDIDSGNICYVMSVWIEKPGIAQLLKKQLFKANEHCEYFAGREVNHNRRLAIFKKRGNHGRRETENHGHE